MQAPPPRSSRVRSRSTVSHPPLHNNNHTACRWLELTIDLYVSLYVPVLGPNRNRFARAILGPKTGSGSSYTPFKLPALWIQPPRIHFVPGHINYLPTPPINSYNGCELIIQCQMHFLNTECCTNNERRFFTFYFTIYPPVLFIKTSFQLFLG